jgi:AhpD family alkylhydroperoxidase
MPRLRQLRDDELPPELVAMLPGKEENVRTFGHQPEIYLRWLKFYDPLRAMTGVEPRTKELARLKIAELNDCAYCLTYRSNAALAEGLTEEMVCALADYERSDLSPREKAAVRFAETLAINHHAIDQPFLDDLLRHFSEAELMELAWSIVAFIASGRLTKIFDINPTRDVRRAGTPLFAAEPSPLVGQR